MEEKPHQVSVQRWYRYLGRSAPPTEDGPTTFSCHSLTVGDTKVSAALFDRGWWKKFGSWTCYKVTFSPCCCLVKSVHTLPVPSLSGWARFVLTQALSPTVFCWYERQTDKLWYTETNSLSRAFFFFFCPLMSSLMDNIFRFCNQNYNPSLIQLKKKGGSIPHIVLSILKWLTLQPLQTAKASADQTFLAWDRERGRTPPPPPAPQ